MKVKKYFFMLNKIFKDIKTPKQAYKLNLDNGSRILEHYYFLFSEDRITRGKDQALINKFDKNGIPINKTYIDVKKKNFVYFPISIGQMGLAIFHTYLRTNSDKDKNRFLKFVKWFYRNAQVTEKLGARWITDVPLPQYKTIVPWQSAFSQSRGISILLRGYQMTQKQKYADMADKALIPFTKPVSEGGVTQFTEWGPFYEEYTAAVPTLVLNGMIFSLCGIYDFVRVFPENNLAKKIFDDGIATLKKILPEYDLGFWSRYNLCETDWYPEVDPATIGYQRLHITQLEVLYKLTGEIVFKEYAERFKKQDNIKNIIKMYRVKYTALKKMRRL